MTKTALRRSAAGSTVALMEDHRETRLMLKSRLEARGFRVIELKSSDEARDAAGSGVASRFILDVHMGKGRAHEGFNAAEKIRAQSPSAFVALITAHGSHDAKRMASKLQVDVFRRKTQDVDEDLAAILAVEGFVTDPAGTPVREPMTSPDQDPNVARFYALMSDPEWRGDASGKYIALVDGELVGLGDDYDEVRRAAAAEYPGEMRMITVVEPPEDDVIDIPTPFLT